MSRPLLPAILASLSCTAAFAAERSPSRLETTPVVVSAAIAGECPEAETAIARAQQEASRVWSRAKVIIQWVTASELPFGSARSNWLVVRCAGEAAQAVESDPSQVLPIAAIRFIDEQPTNTIVLHLENAYTLLLRELPDVKDRRGWFVPFRDIRLGRLLGRAIAHEIGHFLNQSDAHTRGGLMRASHTLTALTGASLAPFSVDEAQARAIHAIRSGAQPAF